MQTTIVEKPTAQSKGRNFRSLLPIVSTIITVGVAIPLLSDAQPRQNQCSASLKTGTIPSHVSKVNNGLQVNVPSMREGQYLSLFLPSSYTSSLNNAASQLNASEKKSFVLDKVWSNIETAYSKLGSAQQATFDCVGLASQAAPDASVVPSARPTALPSALPVLPNPADAGTAQDAGVTRRTVTF